MGKSKKGQAKSSAHGKGSRSKDRQKKFSEDRFTVDMEEALRGIQLLRTQAKGVFLKTLLIMIS